MVSALDSRASAPRSSPGRAGTLCCVLTLTVPLSTQVYKWVPAICWGNLTKLRGSDLRWTSIPSRGSRNTSSRFMLQKPEIFFQLQHADFSLDSSVMAHVQQTR